MRGRVHAGSSMPVHACLVLVFCLMIVTGCAVGPDYHSLETPVPDTWAGPVPETVSQPGPDLARWWTAFDDPVLVSLVERAIASNLDLKLTESRIRQARAARGVSVAGLGPAVSAGSSYQRSYSSQGGISEGVTSDLYQIGFDAAWELDIFGGVRRGVEAADADLLAAVEGRNGVLVTLAAETAISYINLRGFQQQILIARNNLSAQQHSAELTRKIYLAGLTSALDTTNADAQVANTAAQIPVLESSARQAIYSLGLLIAREPGALISELSAPSSIPGAPPSVPAGIPSELLRRRPDIRGAEAGIHAATARIGVATADLFPKFTLSGSAGLQSNDFNSWLNWANRFWSFGPSANWQIFNTGKTLSNIELSKALQEQSFISYQQTVLAALQEVDNALIASVKEREHFQALSNAVAANRKAVFLATQLYTHGQTDFLNVLLAQRSLYASEDALVQSARTVSTNIVALYKALGGGWE
ncbi:MAG: efflux transporter outer membrane subunit [Deltaproteobacteria bacterium]|nr:efflux transporter outer membrane subunit [Deltaproteobacteria bacterium]